ncbi:MAG: hypothetical protein ACOX8Q_01435 [Christensenellales bacterium]|jgi:hypothetical protein
MWGIFVGIAISVLQVLAVSKLGRMILGDNISLKLIGGLLFLLKMAVIVLILYLISTVSFAHLIWTAAGMLLGLVSASVFILGRRKNGRRGL